MYIPYNSENCAYPPLFIAIHELQHMKISIVNFLLHSLFSPSHPWERKQIKTKQSETKQQRAM